MSECWEEGGLRAYCDRELPPEDLPKIAAHLGECAECHARYNELAARAARVSGMMEALGEIAAQAAVPQVRGWVKPAGLATLALAAAAALAFVLVPKRVEQPRPVAAPPAQRMHRPIQAEAPAPRSTDSTVAAAARATHRKTGRQAKPEHTEYFLALDDDPIDMGVVMRVALDGAADVQADVILDAEGRVRAIRPLTQGVK
jgi:anti-sigma factor RsiW